MDISTLKLGDVVAVNSYENTFWLGTVVMAVSDLIQGVGVQRFEPTFPFTIVDDKTPMILVTRETYPEYFI